MTQAARALPVTRERLAQARVLVVGDAMLDRYWFGAVDRISPEAPVPVVRVNREEERLGGAANVALNVKTLGAQATLLTVVGDDEPARKLRQMLAAHGVTALLGSDPNLYTIVKLRVIGRSQQLIRVDFENQPDHEVLASMLSDYEAALPGHDAVLFSDYGKGGLEHIPRMIELARNLGKPVLVDPKGSDYSRYAGATVVTPNRAELAQAVGQWSNEAQLHERAQALRKAHRLDGLLVTRSEEGMSLFDDGAGSGARGIRRDRRRRHRDRHLGHHAGGRPEPARCDADRQPGRRHRGGQVRHRQRELRRTLRVNTGMNTGMTTNMRDGT
jgi:rfaE bifunctional protein kinase chain/domain